MIAALGGGTKAAAQSVQTLTIGGGSGDALDPRNPPFNAKPNDGEDDREQLQQWIDAGCASPNKVLYLPPGDWHGHPSATPGRDQHRFITDPMRRTDHAWRGPRVPNCHAGQRHVARQLFGDRPLGGSSTFVEKASPSKGLQLMDRSVSTPWSKTHLVQLRGPGPRYRIAAALPQYARVA